MRMIYRWGEKIEDRSYITALLFLLLQKLYSLGHFQELIREREKVFHCVWGGGKGKGVTCHNQALLALCQIAPI